MRLEHLGFAPDPVDYLSAWDRQRPSTRPSSRVSSPDTVLLLEHERVYTAGKRTEPHERPIDGTPVIDVDRGGKITWHGPGQLVGYPIVRLPDPVDVVAHVRRLEEMMIRVCADLGVDRRPRRGPQRGLGAPPTTAGPDRKIGAIGIRVSRDVTMHGFALNCDVRPVLVRPVIVPCGIADAGVTSLTPGARSRRDRRRGAPLRREAPHRHPAAGRRTSDARSAGPSLDARRRYRCARARAAG